MARSNAWNEMRAEYIQLRDHVVAGLRAIPGVKCTMPEGAFYAYPNISAFFGRERMKSASDVAGRLLHEAHVATVAGEGFGTNDTFAFRMRRRWQNWIAGWSGCGSSSARCKQRYAMIRDRFRSASAVPSRERPVL